jgi:parallel beta-helix repeat protein
MRWHRRHSQDGSGSRRAASRCARFAVALTAVALAAPAAAGAATFTPVADAWVDAATPTSNFGTRTTLRTDNSPLTSSYLRFNAVGGGSETSATLRVFAETSNSAGFQVRAVTNDTWSETGITYDNAPTFGPVIASSGPVTAGTWYSLRVDPALTGDDLVSLVLTSTSSTATRYTSREGANKPQLIVPAAVPPTTFDITRTGDTYRAAATGDVVVYTGTLKSVGDKAISDVNAAGGGTINFADGTTFDFGSDRFDVNNVDDIVFAGGSRDGTILQNNSSAATDTEPFDMGRSDRVTIRNLTVSANGPFRSTSDAIDFDGGDGVRVENVKITASRGRGIVFDGKDMDGSTPRHADGGTIEGCVIENVPSDGIEMLAAQRNTISGCTVTNVGGHGIQLTKGSSTAGQPNKKASDNKILNNTVDNAGQDGINVNSSDRAEIRGNTVRNSSDDIAGRDGIRLGAADGITCDDTIVAANTATDDQSPKTQRYGLNISTALCNRTVVHSDNAFDGNLTGPIRNLGTGTIFLP